MAEIEGIRLTECSLDDSKEKVEGVLFVTNSHSLGPTSVQYFSVSVNDGAHHLLCVVVNE